MVAGDRGGFTDTSEFRRAGGLGTLASGVCGGSRTCVTLQSGPSIGTGRAAGTGDTQLQGVGIGSESEHVGRTGSRTTGRARAGHFVHHEVLQSIRFLRTETQLQLAC